MYQHMYSPRVRYRDEGRYRDREQMYLGRQEVILVLVVAGYQWEVDNDKEGRVDS